MALFKENVQHKKPEMKGSKRNLARTLSKQKQESSMRDSRMLGTKVSKFSESEKSSQMNKTINRDLPDLNIYDAPPNIHEKSSEEASESAEE